MDRARRHAVKRWGDGKPVVVFGHGLGGNQDQWKALVDHFRGRASLVTFALAGCADADPALFSEARHASVVGFADDLALLCADLGLRDAVYVGHSMSGMAGLLAAAADPGLFGKLVLVNASARYVDDPHVGYVGGFSQDQIDQLLAAIAGDFERWTSGFAPHVMGNPTRPELSTEFTRSLRSYGPLVSAVMFRAAFTGDFRSIVPRVSVPTLVLQSTTDPAVPPEAARWLASTLPQGRLVMLSSTGHFPHVAAPGEVIAHVEAFGIGRV